MVISTVPAELLSVSEAARLAGVAPDTIRLWTRTGRLPLAGRTEGGVRLLNRQDVLRVAAERERRQW